MGKSTLMRQLQDVLSDNDHIETVWFNAWTADEGNALEGLVKSVLYKLDRSILRRAARNDRLVSWARALGLVAVEWLRLGSLVNALWREVSVDPKARNDLRELVVTSVREWANVRSDIGSERLLVVFVDDLDRCSPGNVLQIFEAMKLYLDAPGLVFVVGYDRGVVSDAILDVKEYSSAVTSHQYLEKIVQLVYRLPEIGDGHIDRLLEVYLRASGTHALFDRSVRALTIEQNGRNPRRIKRFINAFILEYALDPEWQTMGPEMLVRVLMIDVYFPDFGRLLRSRARRDPVYDFREYVTVRNILRRRSDTQADKNVVAAAFRSRGIAPSALDSPTLLSDLERELPPSFPGLAANSDFLELLNGIDDVNQLREKLRRYSATAVGPGAAENGIFITSQVDDRDHARRLYEALTERLGADRVMLDLFTASGGRGLNALEALRATLESARVILVVIGPKWGDAQRGRQRESAAALSVVLDSDRSVIPVLVGGAQPRVLQRSGGAAQLARRQPFEITEADWQSDVDRLIDAIEYRAGTATLPRDMDLPQRTREVG